MSTEIQRPPRVSVRESHSIERGAPREVRQELAGWMTALSVLERVSAQIIERRSPTFVVTFSATGAKPLARRN